LALSLMFLCSLVAARDQDDLKFMGVNSVYTAYQITTTTFTVFSTCKDDENAQTCQGRRRRRSLPVAFSDQSLTADIGGELDSGMNSKIDREGTSSDKSEKLLFTIWSTTTTQTLITTTSTNTGTKVSISYACTLPSTSDLDLVEPDC